jgi:prolyl oligopeptidase
MRQRVLLVVSLVVALASLGAQTPDPQTPASSTANPNNAAIKGKDGIRLPEPPEVAAIQVKDDYFGTKVMDYYRWLENAKSPETRDFIEAENQYTDRYMKQAKIRPQLEEDLDALLHVGSVSEPLVRHDTYFFVKRLADEEQGSIYVRHDWKGPDSPVKDERLIDPGSISKDPNTSVGIRDLSRDGNLLAYSVREGGADETTVRVLNLKTKKTLEDELPSGLYLSVKFAPDNKGIYYARMTKQKGVLLYLHTLGKRNATDELIFGHEFHGEPLGPIDLFHAYVTYDGHYLVVDIPRGVPASREDIVYRDLRKPGSPFEILVWGLDARFDAEYAQGKWIVRTNYHAPKWKILLGDPGILPDVWTSIVPEGDDVIDSYSIVGGHLYVHRLHDVKAEIQEYTLDGHARKKLEFDAIGDASGVSGEISERYGFVHFQSFTVPPTIYRVDTTTGAREIFWQSKVHFDSSQYELKQVFFTSKDGTKIPMFIAGKKGLKQDGSERMLMTGYGGFDLSETPAWNPAIAWWLNQGGWFALPNLRGGGEYGEQWHEQGMFARKQNVFDDWFAAAEFLIANHYTSAEHFAIMGRSNGGLLMGASMTQRPDLFAAIECGYPLLDMLRYQKFLQGPQWTTEYGSAEVEEQFPYLMKYSPYQKVKMGAKYPAILFFTGDSDTRVDPLHARKMTALMQASSDSERPVLLHYGLKGGHSAGVSVEQQIQDNADILAFLWTETGKPTPK